MNESYLNELFITNNKIDRIWPRRNPIHKKWWYGDLFFSQGGEEFRVSGLHLHDEIRSYIGRIVEYIKSHGYPEQFSIFRSRKERRKEKNTDHGDEMEI